jgi:hypothetical protein
VAGTVAALLWASRSVRLESKHFYAIATLVAGVASWTSCIFGPFVIVPGAVLGFAAPIAVTLRANLRQRIFLMTTGTLAVALPLSLQWMGWMPPSYEFSDGIIAILPFVVEFPAIPVQLYLAGAALLVIVAPLYVIGGAIDRLVRAERHLFAQAWNLRELMPDGARDAAGAQLVEPPEPSEHCLLQ